MKKRNTDEKRNGFTLAELLVVIAIIAVLVGIAIPVFKNQVEKAKEATDLADIRTAYAEVMTEVIGNDNEEFKKTVDLVQSVDGWLSGSTAQSTLEGLGEVIGTPAAGGTCEVSFNKDAKKIKFNFSGSGSSSSGGSGSGSGNNPGGGSGIGAAIHQTDYQQLDYGVVLQDATGTCVMKQGGTWAMQNDINNMTVKEFCDKYPATAVMVDTSDVKDSSYTGTMKVGDLYYDGQSFYYVSYVNSETERPASGWIKLKQ